MKVFAPLNKGFPITELANVADEFYVGVIDQEWEEKYSSYIGFNTRAFSGNQANFSDWESLADAVKEANEHNKATFLTINAHNLSQSQLPLIKKIIAKFAAIGGKGIICSELNSIELAKEAGLKVFLSTNLALYNVRAIRYLIDNYDIDRVILSRDMRFDEIRKIRLEIDREIEVFGQNLGCRFSNGLCYCTHNTRAKGMCHTSAISRWNYFNLNKKLTYKELYDADLNHYIYSEYLLKESCSLCALYDFLELGINSIKIVGRELPYKSVYESCNLVKQGILIARTCQNRQEYLEKLSNIKANLFDFSCAWGFQCYYPEMGYKKFIEGDEI